MRAVMPEQITQVARALDLSVASISSTGPGVRALAHRHRKLLLLALLVA